MKYNGIELKELTEPQVINPPREMVVWDNDANVKVLTVAAILPGVGFPVATIYDGGEVGGHYLHCADIPEKPKTFATNKQLAEWCAHGHGQCKAIASGAYATANYAYSGRDDGELEMPLRVRKWNDEDWHAPTLEYMGLSDKSESKEDNDGQGEA